MKEEMKVEVEKEVVEDLIKVVEQMEGVRMGSDVSGMSSHTPSDLELMVEDAM